MTQLDTAIKFEELTLVKELVARNSIFTDVIGNVYRDAKTILDNRIPAIFPTYTLHNSGHSIRIINYMGKITDDVTQLGDLEIAILICAALLHDIGMAVSEDDLQAIKSDTYPFSDIKFETMLRLKGGDERESVQEYVRRIHADMSARYIRNHLKTVLIIPSHPGLDFTEELALICESHTKDYDWIKKRLRLHDVRGTFSFNAQYLACLLRLGDILDIDTNRTPYRLYNLISPKDKSDEEWRQHFVIFNDDKITSNERTGLREIVFHGKSFHPDIHRKILSYIDWVREELVGAIALTSSMRNQYYLPFDEKPKEHIQPEGYTFSGYKMTLRFDAISALLMGEKIYGNKNLGLRELIQNSIDACRTRQENEAQTFGEDPYLPKIRVLLDAANDKVIIKDNGVGMSLDIIKNHFLNIGVSYYQSFEFLLKNLHYKPIGNYGIGFLSCFMLSDTVTVKTRHYLSRSQYLIDMNKGNEWTSLTEQEDISFFGTEVILNYRQFIAAFDNKPEQVEEFLKKFFLTDGVEVRLLDSKGKNSIIENLLYKELPLEKGTIKINLSDYLKEIDGYVLIKPSMEFISGVEHLDLDNEIYIYNPLPEDNLDIDNTWIYLKHFDELKFNIDDFFDENQIEYLSIPIIEDEIEEEFKSGMKFTGDDSSEVISKLEDSLRWVTILVPKNHRNEMDDSEIRRNDRILPGLNFSDLIEIGHKGQYPTRMFIKKISLFEGKKNSLYLPFSVSKKLPSFWFSKDPAKDLFIRNVLIKDFWFDFPSNASIFNITKVVVNVNSRKFIPDISRNKMDDANTTTLNYVVSKAVHLGALDSMTLTGDEHNTLNQFIRKYYEEMTEFERTR